MASRRPRSRVVRPKGLKLSSTEFCIQQAIKAEKITADQARDMQGQIERRARRQSKLGSVDAVTLDLINERLEKAGEWKRKLEIQTLKTSEALVRAEADAKGVLHGSRQVLLAADRRANAVAGGYCGRLSKALRAMRVKSAGFWQDRDLIEKTVREMYGENTGNAQAASFGRTFSEINEDMRQRFNDDGGDIRLRQNYHLPQHHDQSRINAVSSERWVADTQPLVQVWDDEVGAYVQPEVKWLEAVRTNIVTGGMFDLKGIGAIGARHADPRMMHFPDAKSFMAYNAKYGSADLFSMLTHHIESRSREIAIMEELGPIPSDAVNLLKGEAVQAAVKAPIGKAEGFFAGRGLPRDPAKLASGQIDRLWSAVSGEDKIPGNLKVHTIMSGVRQLLQSVQLGSATVSSLQDVATIAQTAQWNGIPAARTLGRMGTLLKPGSEDAMEFGIRLGLGAQSWADAFHSGERLALDFGGPKMFSWASDKVMRLSGLNRWTESGRIAFGTEFMGWLGSNVGKPLDELAAGSAPEKALAGAMERYGITAGDWDIVRALPTEGHGKAQYVMVSQLAETGLEAAEHRELAVKFLGMVQRESDFAVLRPDAEVRAVMVRGTQSGTPGGELYRAVGMYKAFPVTMLLTHWRRALEQASWGQRGGYLAQLVIGSTIMGAVSVQARRAIKGQEFENMNPLENPMFWPRAMMTGGGLGLLADFLQAGISGLDRHGRNVLEQIAGPVGGLVVDAVRLGSGNVGAIADKKLRAAAFGDNAEFALKYLPGSSLWYARLGVERLISDQVKQYADPIAARRSFRASEKYWKDEAGVNFWWHRGETLPEALR